MISQFHHSPDGNVYVRTDAATYADTAANFAKDYGQSVPALTDGADERIYEPSIRHALMAAANVVAGGPLPWAFGDGAIAAVATIVAAQTTRTAPPAPTPPTQAEQEAAQCAQVDLFRNQRLAAGFADTAAGMTGKTWQCDDHSQGKWTAVGASALAAIVAQTSPAPTYTLIASDNSEVTLSPSAALALINARIMPWVSATMLYARAMKNNILAGNPPADITAGWP